jgi:hypothetical protein
MNRLSVAFEELHTPDGGGGMVPVQEVLHWLLLP